MDEEVAISTITPGNATPRRNAVVDRAKAFYSTFTTRSGLLGNYDYAYLFKPNLPFISSGPNLTPFFGINDKIPIVLATILGLQHALAMLAGVITPPIIFSGSTGANLDSAQQQYLVSTALIVSGFMSAVQISRFRIPKTGYYIGSGVLTVVGVSFTSLPIGQGAFRQMYANGFCPTDDNGNPLPCPRGYGALIGTTALCAVLEILISFLPPKVLFRMFPAIVTGPTVLLIGVKLIESGFKDWMGGSGECASPSSPGSLYALCPDVNAPRPLPWGSAEFLGLGFSAFITIILCERFGSPIMKSTAVVIGLIVGCVIAGATGYFDGSGIDSAPVVSFVWLKTFPLSVYGPLVLPLMAVYIIIATESVGDLTATCHLSKIETEGKTYESRIQGGILTDGINGVAAGLMTMTPMGRFSQNNGVIALTRCANRKAGFMCCIFLVIMGVFAKFAAALVSIPKPVLGGMTTFLFCAVAMAGLGIIIHGVNFNRRARFILTTGLALGYGATLVPTWFENVFTYDGDNQALLGLLNAIVLIMETGFAVTAFSCMALNALLPDEMDEDIGASNLEFTRSTQGATKGEGDTIRS